MAPLPAVGLAAVGIGEPRVPPRSRASRTADAGGDAVFNEFREFIARGNVIDLAVGIIVGGAFAQITNSLVNDVLMPPIGLLLGGSRFTELFILLKAGATPPPYETLAAAQEAGAVTLNYGVFITQVVNFLIIAWAVFLVVKVVNRLRRQAVRV
jgi:large conductance mechanosensitive channel